MPADLHEDHSWVLEHIDPESEDGRRVLEYVRATQELAPINSQLCSMCANCRFGPIGCCFDPTLYKRGMPDELLRLQMVEAKRTGWEPREPQDRCRFHGERGCVLRVFRPTVCYSHFCEPLVEELKHDYGADRVQPFMDDSGTFYQGPSLIADPGVTVHHMETAIASGRRLLERKRVVDSGCAADLTLFAGQLLEQSEEHAVVRFVPTEQMAGERGHVSTGVLIGMLEAVVQRATASPVQQVSASLFGAPLPGAPLIGTARARDTSTVEAELCAADGVRVVELTARVGKRTKLPVLS